MPTHPAQFFSLVTDLAISFAPHPVFPKMHTDLNNLYADSLVNHLEIYVDPTTEDEVKPDADLLPTIRHILATDMIFPYATETPDLAPITAIINSAALHVLFGNTRRRLNKDSLTRALEWAIAQSKDKIDIQINISHVYLDTSSGPLNYLDWTKLSITKTTITATPAPLTARDIAQAVASAIPPPPTAQQLATAFAAAYPSQPTTVTSSTTANPTSMSTQGFLFTFNHNILPPDVKLRYTNKLDKGLIVGSTTRSPFATGHLYHLENPDKLVLADGTMFIMQTPNEKGLMKAQISCEDDTHSGVRAWYDNFVQACHDFGFYAHPLWCFKADHGGDRGFTIGDDFTDDLPRRMEIAISKMANPLFRLLSKKDMFPKSGRLPTIVRSCDGDGYKALKAVLFKSHPAFYDQPATLITSYPRQRDLTMLEYYKLFLDFEQLRAYIADITITLDDEAELDIFIKNSKYNSYLNRVTRDERRIRSLAHKYRGSQLVETLDKFLLAPDSPALRNHVSPGTSRKHVYHPEPPRRIPIHNIGYTNRYDALALSDHDTTDTDDDTSANTPPNPNQLDSIPVPDNDHDREIYHIYCASICRINSEPNTARSPTCIVCGENHRFEQCDILKNTQFLKEHYITYCQQLRRHASSRARNFPTKDPIPATHPPARHTAPIHFIDHLQHSTINDTASTASESDFQLGRA